MTQHLAITKHQITIIGIWLLVILLLMFAAPRVRAEEAPTGVGLSVEPGGLLIQHVKPGETYDLAQKSGISLKVSNRDTKARTYRLSTHRPSEVGSGAWLAGYAEIPDPSWFWFEQPEVTVAPGGDGHAKMFLRIPPGAQYDNQQWVVSVGVEGTPQAGETMALAAFPRYQIETEASADAGTVPAGPLGVVPSVLQMPIPTATRRVTLWNNDATARRYTFSVKTAPSGVEREQIAPSAGRAWVPEPTWITVKKRHVTIEPHQSRVIEVQARAPSTASNAAQPWEALLWIEPDAGPARFVRIQLEAAQEAPSP